jgi:hypothetical protein
MFSWSLGRCRGILLLLPAAVLQVRQLLLQLPQLFD